MLKAVLIFIFALTIQGCMMGQIPAQQHVGTGTPTPTPGSGTPTPTPGSNSIYSYSNPAPFPTPNPTSIVRVSNITQLKNAVEDLVSNQTIVIAAGTYNISSAGVDALYLPQGISNWAIIGETGNRDDVVIKGSGMAGGVIYGFWIGSATNGAIANLTIDGVRTHGIIANFGAHDIVYHNLHIIDSGDQSIKSNPNGGQGNRNGIVQYSVFEYRTTDNDNYTNGVDVHTGENWIVRYNLFKNFLSPAGQGIAGPAVLMWNSSFGSLVEGNVFINCARGISMGLIDKAGDTDHSGGIVRNNVFYRQNGLTSDVDVPIGTMDSPSTKIYHNTILVRGSYPNAIEYRFGSSSNIEIKNNLSDAGIQARDGASGTVAGNKTNVQLGVFVDWANGNFHLRSDAISVINQGVPIPSGATTDFDGQPRDLQPDLGADELIF